MDELMEHILKKVMQKGEIVHCPSIHPLGERPYDVPGKLYV